MKRKNEKASVEPIKEETPVEETEKEEEEYGEEEEQEFDVENLEDDGEDLDDIVAELAGKPQDAPRFSIYETSILTGIPQRKIRSGDLTRQEIARIEQLNR